MTPDAPEARPAFSLDAALASFDLDAFNDPGRVAAYAAAFEIDTLCRRLEADRIKGLSNTLTSAVDVAEQKPFEPEHGDLCRLHWLCLRRRCLNVLEFGSGFSTAVMADAMRRLAAEHRAFAQENIRVADPFHVYAVEEEQRFLDITQSRLNADLTADLASYVTASCSSVSLSQHDSRFVTYYDAVPNVSPDFIYLDGPSQYATRQRVGGFGIDSPVRMPMAADILRVEFFLEPGTLILVDGRTANARFLKCYLKRDWAYRHDPAGDVHYFELQEAPLGKFNARKLRYCLDAAWML